MSKYLPDYAGVFCLAVFLISLTTIGGELIRDGDSFWHTKVGTVMLEEQGLINTDIFSHTAFGTPWTAHEWLSEIIMASVHNLAGLEGLLCFFLLIVALSFWLLYKITEKNANQWVTFSCVSLALLFSPTHMSARPHMFTWLFMLITLAILTSGGKRLYWLPVIMMIWANLHGGFILGLVLQLIFILGSCLESHLVIKTPCRDILRQQRIPALVLFLCICVIGLNPFGYELLAFPFQVSKGVFSEFITEWKSPNLQDMWYFRFYLVALVLLISFTRSAVTWTERLLIVLFFNAALTHTRHISLMLIALTPFLARMINNHLDKYCHKDFEQKGKRQLQLSAKTGPITAVAIAAALLISGSISHRPLAFLTPEKFFSVETEYLEQLVDYLDENAPKGNMFNEYALGGYLIYALPQAPKVFIDGRADMYGEQILFDYNKIKSSSLGREELLEKYDIDWVVFEIASDLVTDLKKSGYWQTAYTNEHYAVLIKNDINKTSQGCSNLQ